MLDFELEPEEFDRIRFSSWRQRRLMDEPMPRERFERQNAENRVLQEARRGRAQLEEEKEGEEILRIDNVAITSQVFESPIFNFIPEILKEIEKGCLNRKTVDPIILSCLWLISCVIKDIPSCIPKLIQNNIIPSVMAYLKGNIYPDVNYLGVIFTFLSSISFHSDGCAIIKSSEVTVKLLSTFIQQEYVLFYPDDTKRPRPMDEVTCQFMQLFNQAKEIQCDIVITIRNILATLNNNSQNFLKILGSINNKIAKIEGRVPDDVREEREKIWLNVNKHCIMLKNTTNFLNSLIRIVDTREQQKLMIALNENREIVIILLELSKRASMIKTLGEKDYMGVSHFGFNMANIIKFYIKSESVLRVSEKLLINAMISVFPYLKFILVNGYKGIKLKDYEKRKRFFRKFHQ